MGVLVELGVADPVPAFNAASALHQLQQGFWGGAEARQKQVGSLKRAAVTGAADPVFHDPAGADPDLADVLWSLFGAQRPGDVAAGANLVILCHKRDLALSLELRSDLTMQRLLVAFHGQQEVGPLLLELPKND